MKDKGMCVNCWGWLEAALQRVLPPEILEASWEDRTITVRIPNPIPGYSNAWALRVSFDPDMEELWADLECGPASSLGYVGRLNIPEGMNLIYTFLLQGEMSIPDMEELKND